MKKGYWAIVVVLLVLIGAFSAYHFVYNKPHPDFKTLKADYTMNADELYNAFLSNTEEASLKYNGKMIQLEGQVNRIETIDSLVIAVFVFNEGMFGDEGLRCTFLPLENNSQLESIITNNNPVLIKGFCSGYNDVDVILEKCTLENLTPK